MGGGKVVGSHGEPAGEHTAWPNFCVLFVLFILSTSKNVSPFLSPYILSICPAEYRSNGLTRRESVSSKAEPREERETLTLHLKARGGEKVCVRSLPVAIFNFHPGRRPKRLELQYMTVYKPYLKARLFHVFFLCGH